METKVSSDFTTEDRPQNFLIVAIGASAGGIQALKEFFQHVPKDSGMAYVVILHLSPDHDSKLAEVIQMVSLIPVTQVLEKTKIKPNHVYVVPPDKHLLISDGVIAPSQNLHIEDRRAPVDMFFRHLADTHGPRAVCVVLSGTGANGSMGLKRIKERGGAAYVQNPREAEFNEMPRNSIATELVDEVLPVAEIPRRIIAYRNSLGSVQIVVEPEERPEIQQQALREVFTQLRVRTGHDFSNYKRPTLLRRIERRINVRSLPDLPSYTAFIHDHPDETNALLKDLLISVTNFFRDQKAFEALEQDVLPLIFKGKNAEHQVRIWVAGCATGEEAYSIAMLCAERTFGVIDAPKVQIFATDIDETAIATAREGLYTVNDAADVSTERLRRFFIRDGDGYRVRREIREMVLFAHHNFLNDPPFSRLDLVSCRNVLIYLNNTAQERVIETFHFALKPKGFLFLGTSESVDGASDLYAVFSRDNHIFWTREVPTRNIPVPDSVPTFHFAKNHPLQKPEEKESRNQRISFGELHQKLLEQYAPPSVVVNEEYEIVHMSEKVGRYFEFVGGEPTQNLLKLVRSDIRLELRSALYQAVQRKMPVEARNLKVEINGLSQLLDIHVRPVLEDDSTAKGFILVVFIPAEEARQENSRVLLASEEPVARQLEEELIGVRTQLRNSVEQHELQAEELKASNEELQAMNEELRSALEELETSKEELQSINEELRTVNQELKVKVDEASVVSNNLQNLINSADVGTIFLDRSLSVRMFTPAVSNIFNLKSSDHGRPISDITHRLQYDGLIEDAETVMEKLNVIEREVMTYDRKFFMMRLLPYRTSEDRINGVVITFFDITKRKDSEEALRQSQERLQKVLTIETVGVIYFDLDGNIHDANAAFETMSGFNKKDLANGALKWDQLQPNDFDKITMQSKQEFLEKWQNTPYEKQCVRPDGTRWWGLFAGKRLSEHECVEFVVDITDQKNAEEKLKDFTAELEKQVLERTSALNKTTEALQKNLTILQQAEALAQVGSWEYEFGTGVFTWSEGMYDLFDMSKNIAVEPEIYMERAVPEDKRLAEQMVKGIRKGILPLPDTVCIKVGDSIRELKVKATIVKDKLGKPSRMVGVDLDVTHVKQAQKTLSEQAHFIRSTNEALPDILFVMNLETKELVYINHSFEEKMGYTPAQIKNFKQPLFDIVYEEDMPAVLAHLEEMKGLADGVVQETEYRLKAANGMLHWFRDRNAAFRRNREGGVLEKIGIAQDITEAKKAEEALKESNTNLRYANENLQQFASIASHDLQEPLRKLKLFASVLQRFREKLPDEGKEIISKITVTSERMSLLIREVLQFSKIAYAPKEYTVTDLNEVLQNVLNDLELLLKETGATINYPDQLPVVDAIPLQMNQLFYNLLTNAVKFRKENVKPVITIRTAPVLHDQLQDYPHLQSNKTYCEIVFSDNGIGFDPQYAEQIFQIFERLHSVDEFEGTGVGLALCKKIMENHGGHIYAVSNEGAGAAFHILLPVNFYPPPGTLT